MLEKKYSYLYNPLATYRNPLMRFRSEYYVLETSSEGNVGITGLGVPADGEGKGAGSAFASEVKSTVYLLEDGKAVPCDRTELCYTAPEWYWCAPNNYRIVEAGRYVNQFDMLYLRFGASGIRGRLEVFALPYGFILTADCISPEEKTCGLRYEAEFPEGVVLPDGKGGAEIRTGGGRFFVRGNEGTSVCAEKNKLVLTREKFTAGKSFCGLSAKFSLERKEEVLPSVSYESVFPENTSLVYDEKYGIWNFDLEEEAEPLDFNDPVQRNVYDRIRFRIGNPTDRPARVALCFRKSGFRFSVTGMSPVLRDCATGEPTGEAVQITKDWHFHPDKKECGEWFACDADDPRRLYEGKWSHFYVVLEVPARGALEREYVCAYENWGKYCAVSHSQLSLVGWGGYHIWEQTAFGSHGETFCYQMDESSKCGSVIADVRPLYTSGTYGAGRKYDWSGNVGGGELLNYEREGKRFDLCDALIDFAAQCPVLTETRYRLQSEDGKISCSLTVNEGRSFDAAKVFFTYRLTFNESFSYDRLEYFGFPSSRYARKMFGKFAFGEGNAVRETLSFRETSGEKIFSCGENQPWFFFYGVPQRGEPDFAALTEAEKRLAEDQNSNVLLTVRRYAERVGGKTFSAPDPVLRREGDRSLFGLRSHGNGRVEKGDYAEICLEMTVLPQRYVDFYGNCLYFDERKGDFGTPDLAAFVSSGNAVRTEVVKGRLIGEYPIVLRAEDDEAVFRLKGGLGLVNVRVEGLSDYRGLRFEKNGIAVDDGVHGGDFWQTDRSEDGTFRVSVSLDNGEGENLFAVRRQITAEAVK